MENDDRRMYSPWTLTFFLASLLMYRAMSCTWLALERVTLSALICAALLHDIFSFYWVGVHVALGSLEYGSFLY